MKPGQSISHVTTSVESLRHLLSVALRRTFDTLHLTGPLFELNLAFRKGLVDLENREGDEAHHTTQLMCNRILQAFSNADPHMRAVLARLTRFHE